MITELPEIRHLLAVDAGVKTGLALYNSKGQLLWYRSHNMGSVKNLRKAAYTILNSIAHIEYLAVEGGGPVAQAWTREAVSLGIRIITTDAGIWRSELLTIRARRTGQEAKKNAIKIAWQLIKNSEAPSKNYPTHDAAEAILTGLWACLKTGYLQTIPDLNKHL